MFRSSVYGEKIGEGCTQALHVYLELQRLSWDHQKDRGMRFYGESNFRDGKDCRTREDRLGSRYWELKRLEYVQLLLNKEPLKTRD